MATVLGGFPINIIDKQGKEYGIPLSLLSLDKTGELDLTAVIASFSLDADTSTVAAKVVKSLLDTRVIAAAPPSAPVIAMTLTAALAGESGNSLTVGFANPVPDEADQAKGKIDVTIGWTDRRPGLTVVSLGQQLGTPDGGSAPSLVTLAEPAAAMPAAMGPSALGGTPPELVVNAADSSPAFKLVTSHDDPLIAGLEVEIADVDDGAETFTLIVTVDFSKPGVELSDLAATLAPLATLEPGTNGLAMPAEGTVAFAGGASATSSPAQAAKGIVLTD